MSARLWYCEDHESPQFVDTAWCQYLGIADYKGPPCAFTLMRLSRIRDEGRGSDGGGAYGDGSDLGEFMEQAKREADKRIPLSAPKPEREETTYVPYKRYPDGQPR